MIGKKPTLVDDAVSRLAADFQSKKVMVAMLRSWLDQVKRLDDVVVDSLSASILGSAVGEQLNAIGHTLGEQRRGLYDEAYTQALRISIRAKASTGRIEDLFDVFSLLLAPGAWRYSERPPAEAYAEAIGVASSIVLVLERLLRYVKPAGARLVLVSSPMTRASVAAFGSTSTAGQGVGLASVTSPSLNRVSAHVKGVGE